MNTKANATKATKQVTAATPEAVETFPAFGGDDPSTLKAAATPAPTKQAESSRKSAISIDVFKSVITLTFANGKALELDTATCSEAIREAAMFHGFKQKLADAAAIARNPDTGASATIDDKYNAVKEVFDRISSPDGQWNKNREGGEASPNLLIRALMEYKNADRERIVAWLDGKSKEELAAVRKVPAIATIMARLSAEKANVNADDVLAGL